MGWRDTILGGFDRSAGDLYTITDLDGLLGEERVHAELRARGFELLLWKSSHESTVEFTQWKGAADTKARPALVVVTPDTGTARSLRRDVRDSAIDLGSVGLGRSFPKLSYPVLCELDYELLDRLEEVAQQLDRELGDAETRTLVLRHGYGIDPAVVRTPEDLLRLLFVMHAGRHRLPVSIANHLVAELRRRPALASWPVESWVVDRANFIAAVQAQWPGYLASHAGVARLDVGFPAVNFDVVRAEVTSLFLDGVLSPVALDAIDALPAWARIGVARVEPEDRIAKLARHLEHAATVLPAPGATHRDWIGFAWVWAELTRTCAAMARPPGGDLAKRLLALRQSVDASFELWMLARYGVLWNAPRPGYRPVMVHHVVDLLAHHRGAQGKVALVVIDGMAIDQWLLLRDALQRHDTSLRFDEDAVFAWVPTVTSVSRQALFTGRLPMNFAKSFDNTASEESGWKRAWDERGVPSKAVRYARGSTTEDLAKIEEIAGHPHVTVVGLVLNQLDDLMHGAELGLAQLHRDVDLWVEQGAPHRTLRCLLDAGFEVFVTADHGNIEAHGMGHPNEGVRVETGGERARVYEHETSRKQTHAAFPETIEWPGLGLPESKKVLLARGRRAFLREGDTGVVHGGIALEEVLVPFVKVHRP